MHVLAIIIAFSLVPLFVGLSWIYASPLPSAKLGKLGKAVIRTMLFVTISGGILAQENYLGDNVPPSQRSFDLGFCFLLEAIPILFILFYRYYRNPGAFKKDRSSKK
jgi:hypothetical protein